MPPLSPPSLPRLRQSYAQALPDLSRPCAPRAVPGARVLLTSPDVARQLGIEPDALRSEEGLALLTGRLDTDGTPLPSGRQAPEPPLTTAQAYAGHQFGQPAPVLGDGRAVLLGDLETPAGDVVDLHLKGSGRTPFSRGGDGLAPLGPMLRELVISEYLAATGTPTTRALAVLATGEQVMRRRPEPGALLVRAAASHLRVGTFEYAAWHLGPAQVRDLAAYAISRHWPSAADEPEPLLALLRAVVHAQADLVARWMLLGFVHGVMNTDNMTISGEGIDYGPCAFLDAYDPQAAFSSIDTAGRYAYGRQPAIALWNLTRLAETLLPALGMDAETAAAQATAVLEEFAPAYKRAWTAGMAAKIGVPLGAGGSAEADAARLGAELLDIMAAHSLDHTATFRSLAEDRPDARLGAWLDERERVLGGLDATAVADAHRRMAEVSPALIPRNRVLDAALQAAEAGDLGPVQHILDGVREPWRARDGFEDLALPGPETGPFTTYCGT